MILNELPGEFLTAREITSLVMGRQGKPYPSRRDYDYISLVLRYLKRHGYVCVGLASPAPISRYNQILYSTRDEATKP